MDESEYARDDQVHAFAKSLEWGEKIPLGVFYEKGKPVFEDDFDALKSSTLVKSKYETEKVNELIDSFV